MEVLKALGVEPADKVESVEITFKSDRLPRVTVGYVITDEARELVDVFTRHELRIDPPAEEPDPHRPSWDNFDLAEDATHAEAKAWSEAREQSQAAVRRSLVKAYEEYTHDNPPRPITPCLGKKGPCPICRERIERVQVNAIRPDGQVVPAGSYRVRLKMNGEPDE
ncbi:MAG: hypothetical protein INR70_06645 [Parafilimonas terrae]|nr:hypothetical protein [Parafilimonas terrae]